MKEIEFGLRDLLVLLPVHLRTYGKEVWVIEEHDLLMNMGMSRDSLRRGLGAPFFKDGNHRIYLEDAIWKFVELNKIRNTASKEIINLFIEGWAQMVDNDDFKILNRELEKVKLNKIKFRDMVSKSPEVKIDDNLQ